MDARLIIRGAGLKARLDFIDTQDIERVEVTSMDTPMNILEIFAKGSSVVWILFTYSVVALMVISVIQSTRKVSNRQLIN